MPHSFFISSLTGQREQQPTDLPTILKPSHGYLLQSHNRPIVIPTRGTPLATNRRKNASAQFQQQYLWAAVCVILFSVQVFICEREKERDRQTERERESKTPPPLTYMSMRTQRQLLKGSKSW